MQTICMCGSSSCSDSGRSGSGSNGDGNNFEGSRQGTAHRARLPVLSSRRHLTCHHFCIEVVRQLFWQAGLHGEGLVQELLVE